MVYVGKYTIHGSYGLYQFCRDQTWCHPFWVGIKFDAFNYRNFRGICPKHPAVFGLVSWPMTPRWRLWSAEFCLVRFYCNKNVLKVTNSVWKGHVTIPKKVAKNYQLLYFSNAFVLICPWFLLFNVWILCFSCLRVFLAKTCATRKLFWPCRRVPTSDTWAPAFSAGNKARIGGAVLQLNWSDWWEWCESQGWKNGVISHLVTREVMEKRRANSQNRTCMSH